MMDRRKFLGRTAFFTVAAASLSACGGGDDGEPAGRYAFPQGVASGDPKDSSVVFWSRCVRTSANTDSGDIPLALQVSTRDDFTSLVANVTLAASATYDFTVRAKVTGLAPATRLYYRFLAGGDTSAVGTTRTAPASGTVNTQVKFAWFTCQDWSVNHWGAMSLMAQEEFDFLVHVGDYIYETVGASFQAGDAEPAHTAIQFPNGTTLPDGSRYATTLADYRTLYRTYRGDAGCRRCMPSSRSSPPGTTMSSATTAGKTTRPTPTPTCSRPRAAAPPARPGWSTCRWTSVTCPSTRPTRPTTTCASTATSASAAWCTW